MLTGIPRWVIMFNARQQIPNSVPCRSHSRLRSTPPKIPLIRPIAVSANDRLL